MNTDLIYVYCLSKSLPALGSELKSANLKSIAAGNFYVTMKYVSESDFSEENFRRNLSDILWMETNTRDHVGLISLLMELNTVLPFKFGTIFLTEDSLRKFVSDNSGSLIENFNRIKNKQEWSVKIFCDRNFLRPQIDELSEEAAALEKEIMISSPGKAYLMKRKKTDLVENEMDRICKKYGQEYFNAFNVLSEANSLNNLLPKEFTGREDTMILNAGFLVDRNQAKDFQKTAENIRKKHGNFGFSIEMTGPWPPFSFISINEKTA
jgi:hypothetical protein